RTELGEPAPSTKQRLLERVLGVVQRAEHPVAVRLELGLVLLDDAREGGLVAGASRVERLPPIGGGRSSSHPYQGRRAPAPKLIARPMSSANFAGRTKSKYAAALPRSRRPPRAPHRQPRARFGLLHAGVRLVRGDGRGRALQLPVAEARRRD